jgi:flagellar basal-body rod protein FlgB
MTTENLTLMQGFTKKIGWNETRQKLLAEVIANADTPGYRPHDLVKLNESDLKFKDLLGGSTSRLSLASGQAGGLAGTEMGRTNAAHMGSGGVTDPGPESKKVRRNYETAPAGNAVVLEEQLLKMGENYADHRLMTNLYQKNIDMLKISVK